MIRVGPTTQVVSRAEADRLVGDEEAVTAMMRSAASISLRNGATLSAIRDGCSARLELSGTFLQVDSAFDCCPR